VGIAVVTTGLNGMGREDWGGIVFGDSQEGLTEMSDIDMQGVCGKGEGTAKSM